MTKLPLLHAVSVEGLASTVCEAAELGEAKPAPGSGTPSYQPATARCGGLIQAPRCAMLAPAEVPDTALTKMANVQGPFGFVQVGTASGPPNFAQAGSASPYLIKSTFTTPIYFGDAVRMWVSGDSATASAGYITPWVNGDGAGAATKILVGIFVGCRYLSTSQKKTIWNNYYPGSDAAADVEAFVVDDPNSQWKVQANSGPINYTSIGACADVAASPVGNTTTGISGMSLGTPTTTVTLPFKVVNIVTSPPGVNGADDTTAYNNVIVAFNNQQYKALLGV